MATNRKTALAVLATLAATSVLAACGGDDDDDGTSSESGEQLKLSVVSLKPGSEPAAFEAFDAQVEEFEAANTDIDIEGVEYQWEAPTFAAQLAGGTLPTVFEIPFTDGKTLIENEQLADLSEYVGEYDWSTSLNPNVAEAGQDDSGNIFAVPKEGYGIGLHYNRTLFEQAGLDPDQPPTTWAEVREYAKQIADTTGQAGYAQMTKDNTGGWMLTTLSYAFGGRLQEGDRDSATSTIDNPETTAALEALQAMRWEDNSMGSEFLYDWTGINQAFAAGKIGMYMTGSDVYTALSRENQINPDDYGLAALPLADGGDAGVLGGGTLIAVSAKASDEEKAAAAKWIDFYYMQKLVNEERAVADAKTLSETDQPVGTPVLPVFDKAQYDQSREWIADYINVPLDQMSSFTENIFSQQIVGEPTAHTQEVYAVLDSVVQTVLTTQGANISDLLSQAQTQAQNIIDQG